MERTLSAPSKLMLAGEYAVLWGGTARVAAVGPRGHAFVKRRDDRQVDLFLSEGRLSGRATPHGVHWPSVIPAPFAFAARALDEVLRVLAHEALGFSLAMSPGAQSVDGHKLGLGGSARACVLAAEAARYVCEARADALKVALLAHAGAQGGKGSGADVAACFAGGFIRFRGYDVGPLVAASSGGRLAGALVAAPPVDLARLPAPKFSLAFAFTGQSAVTAQRVAEVELALSGERRARFCAKSEEWGGLMEDALLSGDKAALATATGELEKLLAQLPGVETEGIRRILALAQSYGACGKVSGAGGGDGCVLFCADLEQRTALLEGLAARGFLALPLELEPGLRGEEPVPELKLWVG